MPNLDPLQVKLQIEWLYRECPEMETDETLRADMLEGHTDLHKFLSTLEWLRREAVAMIVAIDRLLQRKQRFKRRIEAVRRVMFNLLQLAQVRKIELPEVTLSLKKGSPHVIVIDESAIPDDLCRFVREPDKEAIKTTIQNGGHVPGATLSNAEETISIRTR